MKAKLLLKTGVFCLAAIGCIDLQGPRDLPAFGVGAAQAKDFYTRKKIDGKWVTGVFPKKGSKLEAELAAKAAAPQPAPEPPQPTLLGLNIPGIDLTYRPPMSSQRAQAQAQPAQSQAPQAQSQPEQTASVDDAALERTAYTGTRTSRRNRTIEGTPGVQDRPAVAESVKAEPRRTRTVRSAEPKRERVAERRSRPTAAERRRADEEFAAAVAQPTRTAEPALPAAAQGYAPILDNSELLTALQRKARAIVADEAGVTGSVTPAATVRPAQAVRPVRTVTIDYEAGIKTTIYQDGTIEEEAARP
ncbi:MAG TPA: hypothetical protein VGU45_03475 [Microvirga sp.]|jgi:hypothetical protein|nr:hypothetical protein [Microvirga sp.]